MSLYADSIVNVLSSAGRMIIDEDGIAEELSKYPYLRIMLKGIPVNIDTFVIEKELETMNLPVVAVYRMHRCPGNKPTSFVLVHLNRCDEALTLLGPKHIFNKRVLADLYHPNPKLVLYTFSRNAPDNRLEVLDKNGMPEFFDYDNAPEWQHMRSIYIPWSSPNYVAKQGIADWEGLIKELRDILPGLKKCKSWIEVFRLLFINAEFFKRRL